MFPQVTPLTMDMSTNVPEPFTADGDLLKEGLPVGLGDSQVWDGFLLIFVVHIYNVKALGGAFNQEKALVGAVSVIVKPMDRFTALASCSRAPGAGRGSSSPAAARGRCPA